MLFKNKASVQYVLTFYSVEHNKQYKVIKSDTNRLVVGAYMRHVRGQFKPVVARSTGCGRSVNVRVPTVAHPSR